MGHICICTFACVCNARCNGWHVTIRFEPKMEVDLLLMTLLKTF